MIAQELKIVRESLGFATARSFYQDFLSRKSNLDFNYSYYMKIEGGRALPSPAVISSIASLMKPEQRARLIRAYCKSLFPQDASLFTDYTPQSSHSSSTKKKNTPAPGKINEAELTLIKQRYLTEAQIACLTRSKIHYYVFLILTLSRRPVSMTELKETLKAETPRFAQDFKAALEDLEKSKLAHIQGDQADCSTKEMKFPSADTESLKKLYARIDQWNAEFSADLQFEQPINKMLVRRVSKRYHTLLMAQTQLIIDLLKASDEVQQDYNDEVLMLNFTIAKGQLPG